MLRDLTLADALIVTAAMRPQDAKCVRAMTGQEPGEWFAVDRWRTQGPAWCLWQAGQPWLIAGLSMGNPWSGVLWMVARPGVTGESWRKVIRQTRTVVANALTPARGLHRVEALTLDGWNEAAAFAARVGLQHEGVRHHAGAAGETFHVWAATAREMQTCQPAT